jgi:RHS repeat-associated protein
MAVMVSVTAINPTGTGVLGVGTTEADLGGGIVVFDPAQHASTTMIIPLTDTGTFTIGSWTETDVAVDVIGVFRAPTRTWRYEYDTTGMRTAKQLDNTAGTGVEWRKEHTWTASGGLPLLLAEHQGAQSAYVIYGPGGTPIYQINTTGEVQYLHQDHQGSTRLTTNANGTTRNTITYNAHGEITANTNWWLEQPLAGYTGQYHDPETGYIYLRARHYDPTTGQFTTVDPLVAITEEPYGYVGGNPANRWDPSGLDWYNPFSWDVEEILGAAKETAGVTANTLSGVNGIAFVYGMAVSGGKCFPRDGMIECRGVGGIDNRPFTMGNVVFNPYDTAMDSQSFEHEKRHGGQWAFLGWGFMTAYAFDWLGAQAWYDGHGRPESCDPEIRMFLERSAGLEGEYSCECGK